MSARKILLAAVGAATVAIAPIACTDAPVSNPPDAGPVGNLVPPPIDASPAHDAPVGNLVAPPPDGSAV
jgi:hypothetical protein